MSQFFHKRINGADDRYSFTHIAIDIVTILKLLYIACFNAQNRLKSNAKEKTFTIHIENRPAPTPCWPSLFRPLYWQLHTVWGETTAREPLSKQYFQTDKPSHGLYTSNLAKLNLEWNCPYIGQCWRRNEWLLREHYNYVRWFVPPL